MNTTKFMPGEVTPAQLEQYRQQLEAARQAQERAIVDYKASRQVYRATWDKCEEAAIVYAWAKQGMVKEEVEG